MSLDQVREFNETFGVRMREAKDDIKADVRVPEAKLRFRLIKEELHEFLDAYDECDIVEVLDALGDIDYVLDGAALVFGVTNTMNSFYNKLLDGGALRGFDRQGVELILTSLRHQILADNANEVGQILGVIKATAYSTATELNLFVPEAVDAIHESNMSKLGEDGKPIYREGDRKVLKGPNYKTPTSDLESLLFGETDAKIGE